MPDRGAPKTLDVPGLGTVTRDERVRWYRSNPIHVPFLGQECQVILKGYAEDDRKTEFHAAIANFLQLDETVLRDADEPLLRYYKDYEEWWVERGKAPLCNAAEAWSHVSLGREPAVTRRAYGDQAIYVSIECECAWEEEHGLQLVFKTGLRINKLGGYDGHLTNADAYADAALEDVIYHPLV